MIHVGDTGNFALGCLITDPSSFEGEVYIFVKDKKFGSKNGEFSLSDFFKNIKVPLGSFNPVYPELFNVSATDIFKSLDSVWDDTSIEQCPLEDAVLGFFDDPSDVTSRILFYGGDYAFDGISIVLISDGSNTRLIIRDEDSLNLAEAVLKDGQFEQFFEQLADKVSLE